MAALVGCLQQTYEEALEYAKTRVQGGKPILEHPMIAVKLSDMRIKIEAARLLVYKNAWSHDNECELDHKMFFLTKGFVNEIGPKIALDAMEILGGIGTDKDVPMQKNLRDIIEQLHLFGLPSMAMLTGRPEL
ncbi:acyl-CoA dehydrogenase family protein [Chloroflexota bacterium]